MVESFHHPAIDQYVCQPQPLIYPVYGMNAWLLVENSLPNQFCVKQQYNVLAYHLTPADT
jgi:hypothetical protein